jgi:hypothetical protein
MSEPVVQHVQFGSEIHPVKSNGSGTYVLTRKLSEKNVYGAEDAHTVSADEDLNTKRKQVRFFGPTDCYSLYSTAFPK